MDYQFLTINLKNRVYEIVMDRTEVHNAFNDKMIAELTSAFKQVPNEAQIVVLTGNGKTFSAGADLNWMKSMKGYSKEENIDDSQKLAELFNVINFVEKPVIGKINGSALGGGLGLISVCDFAITHNKAKFGFTEAKLGLIPAVISPFVINKIGSSHARALFLSGERFTAHHAYHTGLIHRVVPVEDFETESAKLIAEFLSAGREAQVKAKHLIRGVLSRSNVSKQEMAAYTAEQIAEARISDEGQEGMNALLEKRKPSWVTE